MNGKSMKTILLLKMRIKEYFASAPIVSISFIACNILISFIMVFIYCNFGFVSKRNRTDFIYTYYPIQLNKMCTLDFLNRFDRFTWFQSAKSIRFLGGTVETNQTTIYIGTYIGDNLEAISGAAGRTVFSDHDIQNRDRVAIVSNENNIKIGNYITLGDYGQFMVIGTFFSAIPEAIIPYSIFAMEQCEFNKLNIRFEKRLTDLEQIEFEKDLRKIDEIANVATESTESRDTFKKETYIAIGILLLIAVIAFLTISQYMADTTKRSNILFRMLGYQKKDFVYLLFLERVIFIISSLIFGMILFSVLKDGLQKAFGLPPIYIVFSDYLILCIIGIFVAVISAMLYVVFLGNKSYIKLLKQGG